MIYPNIYIHSYTVRNKLSRSQKLPKSGMSELGILFCAGLVEYFARFTAASPDVSPEMSPDSSPS